MEFAWVNLIDAGAEVSGPWMVTPVCFDRNLPMIYGSELWSFRKCLACSGKTRRRAAGSGEKIVAD